MMFEFYGEQLLAALLFSLRLAPTLAFAPPFTYLRVPALIRVILALGLSAWMITASPDVVSQDMQSHFIAAASFEFLIGIALALSLQLAFAAILTAGRAIDFQVGFAFALLADPTLRTQMPLVGTLLVYAAGAVFFGVGGFADLLAIWKTSLAVMPLGSIPVADIPALLQYLGAVFSLALGLGGIVILALFATDLSIGLLSRTLPQMNVLMLGFQVKALVLLATLPLIFSLSGALFLQIVRLALDATLASL